MATPSTSAGAPVLAALVTLAQAETSPEAEALLSEKDDDPEDLEALDAVWEEAMVTFGPDPAAGCPISRGWPGLPPQRWGADCYN
jgi:nitrate reductase molybdenum cofactor assembly chaperone NarJ/NarW